ncbi:MAG: hypothetical protein Q9218_001901 [Villophora microphyllina]
MGESKTVTLHAGTKQWSTIVKNLNLNFNFNTWPELLAIRDQILSCAEDSYELDWQLWLRIRSDLKRIASVSDSDSQTNRPSGAFFRTQVENLKRKLKPHVNMIQRLLDLCNDQIRDIGSIAMDNLDIVHTCNFVSVFSEEEIILYYKPGDLSLGELRRLGFLPGIRRGWGLS